MPKWITAVFVFFLSTTLFTARAITVDDIITKHINMTGINKPGTQAVVSDFFNYSHKDYKAALEGVENVEGRTCYKIRLEKSSGDFIYFLIDSKTWIITRKYKSNNTNIAEPASIKEENFKFQR